MINTNISNFRDDIYNIIENTIKYNEVVNINTKNGNAFIISEEDYNGLLETVYLSSIPPVREAIIEGLNSPIEEGFSEEEVEW